MLLTNFSSAANVNSFASSPLFSLSYEATFLSLLVAFRDTATRRHSEIKKTRSTTKQDFPVKNKTSEPH